jgi:hypothetical protein
MVHKDTILVSLVLIVGTCLHVPTSELLLIAPSLALLACVPTVDSHNLHDRLLKEELVDRKLLVMEESDKRRDMNRSAIAHIDITENGSTRAATTKAGMEDHPLMRKPDAYWAAGSTPVGPTDLGRHLGIIGDSHLADSMLDAIMALTSNLCIHHHISATATPTIITHIYLRAFGGLREKSAYSISGLYNAHYVWLKKRPTLLPNL